MIQIPIKQRMWIGGIIIMGLILIIVLSNYKGCNKPLPSTHTEDKLIDSLNSKIKSDEQINNPPDLTDKQRDTLFSNWEKETGLSRFRDSLN